MIVAFPSFQAAQKRIREYIRSADHPIVIEQVDGALCEDNKTVMLMAYAAGDEVFAACFDGPLPQAAIDAIADAFEAELVGRLN